MIHVLQVKFCLRNSQERLGLPSVLFKDSEGWGSCCASLWSGTRGRGAAPCSAVGTLPLFPVSVPGVLCCSLAAPAGMDPCPCSSRGCSVPSRGSPRFSTAQSQALSEAFLGRLQRIKGASASIKNTFNPVPLGSDFLNLVCFYPLRACAEELTAWGSTCPVHGRGTSRGSSRGNNSCFGEENRGCGCLGNQSPSSQPETPGAGVPPFFKLLKLNVIFSFPKSLFDSN